MRALYFPPVPRVGFSFLLLSFIPGFARETVLEDTPSRLILEVDVPAYRMEEGLGGPHLAADGFFGAEKAGAPDLPRYRFQIATGVGLPSVSLEPEAWVELPLSGELAGTPRWLTPRKAEAFRDAALFADAVRIVPEVSGPRRYRGFILRDIALPLGTYASGSGRVRMLKRFRVRVDFPPAANSSLPSAGTRDWLAWAGVKNPRGGQYLEPIPRRGALRKTARTSFSLGDLVLKVRIGDKQLDGFAEDSVYALTYDEALAASGSIRAARIAALRMFAGPKDTLPIRLDSTGWSMSPTLQEIPIDVRDNNNDGTFDTGDSILFYAHGTSVWKPIPGAVGPVRWNFTSDPYSFDNFYYLDWTGTGTGTPLRLATDSTPASGPVFTATPQYLRAERDEGTGSCDPSGRIDDETGFAWYWYWKGGSCSSNEPLTLNSTRLNSASMDTLRGDTGDSLWLGAFVFLDKNRDFQAWVGGDSLLGAVVDGAVSGQWFVQPPRARNERLGLDSLVWAGFNHRFEGYTVRYERRLQWSGQGRTVFPVASGRVTYHAQGGAGMRCLRISKGVGEKWLAVSSMGGDGVFSDSTADGDDVQYFLYRNAKDVAKNALIAEPIAGGVSPQGSVKTLRDLSTGDGENPEYLVIAPESLLVEAMALARYRDTLSSQPLHAAVVRTEDIYREWSGGRLSPTAIRDLLRWALWHWGPGGGMGRLKYVLLCGDGHYDYRNLRNAVNPLPNHIPPFNWDQDDWDPMNTDDFFAILDSAEDWNSQFGGAPLLDVALGRLPAQSREQARSYLEKLRLFEAPGSGGDWRSRVVLTADDAWQHGQPGNIDPVTGHTNQSENLAGMITGVEPGIRLEKVYLFDYPFNSSFLKPEATQDLIDLINRGTSLVTFMGHGAYNQWADEVLLKTNDALTRMRNAGKAFLVAVFSCTVGRFDKITDDGMMEQFTKQKDFGAIAGLGASRESYPGPNEQLGAALLHQLFPGDTTVSVPGLGQALQLAKNSFGAIRNSQKYILFGDPAAAIRRPRLAIVLDRIPDTLRALGCDTLRGRIQGGSGSGSVNVRIVSGDVRKAFPFPDSVRQQVEMKRGQILFERTVDYRNGAFAVDYFIPKQVPFGDSTAKIQLFAWDSTRAMENSHAVLGLSIQGTASGGACSQDRDGRGPRISVTGCNVKESGEVDFPDRVRISLPYCLQIEATDSVGGVMSGGGPDEGTTVELTGVREPFHPQPGVDDLYRKTYQLTVQRGEASLGPHLLKVTARDGFGNLSRRQVTLDVASDSALNFVRAFNAPNPVKRGGTTFYFSTLLPSDEGALLTEPLVDRVRFDLRIFDQGGRMVYEVPVARSGETRWDGKDAWGRSLANGVYFYSVTATTDWTADQGGRAQKTSRRNILVLSR